MEVYIERKFSAAHRLQYHPGKCKNLHGHTYRVEVWINGMAWPDGMVVDFGYIKNTIDYYDHAVMLQESDPLTAIIRNEFSDWRVIVFDTPPTAETIAVDLIKNIAEIKDDLYLNARVRVWESETCYAEISSM